MALILYETIPTASDSSMINVDRSWKVQPTQLLIICIRNYIPTANDSFMIYVDRSWNEQ